MDQRQRRAAGVALLCAIALFVAVIAASAFEGGQPLAVEAVVMLAALVAFLGLVGSLGYIAVRLVRD